MALSLFASQSIFAMEWSGVAVGVLLVILLFGLILTPVLFKINKDGKRELGRLRRRTTTNRVVLGPSTPPGAGDNQPGSTVDPAPGMPDGQADPYSPEARHAS
jgi:hypothetical protein